MEDDANPLQAFILHKIESGVPTASDTNAEELAVHYLIIHHPIFSLRSFAPTANGCSRYPL
jgi:hypothetical protein